MEVLVIEWREDGLGRGCKSEVVEKLKDAFGLHDGSFAILLQEIEVLTLLHNYYSWSLLT